MQIDLRKLYFSAGSNAGYIPCAKHLSYLDMFQDDGTIRPDYQLLQSKNHMDEYRIKSNQESPGQFES